MEDQVIMQKSRWSHDLEYRAGGGVSGRSLSDVPDKALGSLYARTFEHEHTHACVIQPSRGRKF